MTLAGTPAATTLAGMDEGNNAIGSNHRVFPNGYTFEHCTIHPQPDIILDGNGQMF